MSVYGNEGFFADEEQFHRHMKDKSHKAKVYVYDTYSLECGYDEYTIVPCVDGSLKVVGDGETNLDNFVKIAEGNFENKVEKTSKMMNHNYDFEALEKDSKMAATKRAKEIDLKVLPKEEKPKDEKPVYKGDYEKWILECEEWERRRNDI